MIPRDNEFIRIVSESKAKDGRIQTVFTLGRFLITWNEHVKPSAGNR